MAEEHSLSALRQYPDIARRVGLIIADYAILEYQIFIIYAVLSPKNPVESFSSFYRYISANNKCGLVLEIAESRLSSELFRALDRLFDRFKKAANRRTEVAHCVFVGDSGGPLLRLRLKGNHADFQPLDTSILDRTTSQYRTLSTDLAAFLTLLVPSREALLHTLHALPRAPHLETLVGSDPWSAPLK